MTPRTHGKHGWTLLLTVPPVGGILVGLVSAIAFGRSFAGALGAMVPSALMGVAVGLALLLPLVFVFHAARQVGRARSGSVVDLSDRRRVWMVVVTCVTWFVLIMPFPVTPNGTFRLATFSALPLVFAVVDVLAWNDVRVERARHGATLLLGSGADGRGAEAVDLGVGEERWVLAGAALTYRDPGTRETFARGDFRELARRLAISAAWGVGCSVLLGVTWWFAVVGGGGR